MKVVIIDCATAGASGDKLLAALVHAGGRELKLKMERVINSIFVEGRFFFEETEVGGSKGLRVCHDFHGSRYEGDLIEAVRAASLKFGLGSWGTDLAIRSATLIMEAEREVHGGGPLHELGEMDTVVDIVGTAKALEELGLEGAEFFMTPLRLGSGWVECDHGILPNPAPATTEIIRRVGLSVVLSPVMAEITTPTGAAILAALTNGKTTPPPFYLGKVGVGFGTRKLDFPNILRVMVGDSEEVGERVKLVECNVDDVSGEVLGWLAERVKGVAEDFSFMPIFAKKCRPGFTVRVVVRPEFTSKVVDIIMKEIGTLGVKVLDCTRIKADREASEEIVKIGKGEYKVRVKRSKQASRLKPEYEDLREIAVKEGMSLRGVMEEVTRQIMQKYMSEG